MYNYDEFYKKYPVNQHDAIGEHHARFASIASLCKGKILDLGCGTGSLADYFFGDYTGLDISKVAIEKAKEIRRKDAKFFVHNCTDLSDYDVKDFDTIVLAEFLEHIENDDKIFDVISKNAKKDARLIITCPNGPRIPDESHVRELTIPILRKKLSPLGKVKFYNWPGAVFQILCSVDLDQKNDNLVSLVMIVKDEEKGLEKAIFSAMDFCDDIVIAVDNKSTDKTLEIAKLYADVLKTFEFQNDFSAARNFAHEGVKTKWCFFLDGHEYVAKRDNLEKFLALENDGLLISIELENGFSFPNPRFYKTGCYFEGAVHEKQSCKTTILYPDFLIKHDRLTAQSKEASIARQIQRDEMTPRIMLEQLKKDPKNIRALFHMGNFYQARGNFKKAIAFFDRYLKFSKNIQERWFVFFQRSLCFLAMGKNFRAFFSISRADWELRGRWETKKLKGLLLFQQKKYQQALEYFVSSFDPTPYETLYRPFLRDDAGTWNLIGECFFNLGDFDRAAISFDRAAELTQNEIKKKFFEKRGSLMREILKQTLLKKQRTA